MPKCLYLKSKVLDPSLVEYNLSKLESNKTNFIEGWKFDFSFHRISRI